MICFKQSILQYRSNCLKTVTIVSAYNDNRLHPQELEQQQKNLNNLITIKFQPKTLIMLKTVQSCNNSKINSKIYIQNLVLFNLKNRIVQPHTLIISPSLNLNLIVQMFLRDGIYFLFYGNAFFTNFLANLIYKLSG